MGALMVTSVRRSVASSRFVVARTSDDWALAYSSCLASYSCAVITSTFSRVSLRSSWRWAMFMRSRATARSAAACS